MGTSSNYKNKGNNMSDFTWSYSALKQYQNCPKQYYEIRVAKNYTIIDYKTGSNKYPDPKQLKLMAIMLFTQMPEVVKIKAGLLFVLKNSFLSEEYHRKDMDKLWQTFEQPLKRLETSYDYDQWVANPSPLCGWCSVDSCEFYKPKTSPF
jgi:hypothetical protein